VACTGLNLADGGEQSIEVPLEKVASGSLSLKVSLMLIK
jgi:hypothetical protein